MLLVESIRNTQVPRMLSLNNFDANFYCMQFNNRHEFSKELQHNNASFFQLINRIKRFMKLIFIVPLVPKLKYPSLIIKNARIQLFLIEFDKVKCIIICCNFYFQFLSLCTPYTLEISTENFKIVANVREILMT